MSKIKVNEIEKASGSGITIPTGTSFTVADGMGVAGGGTGLTSFTAGDLLYATGSTTLAKLAKGTANQTLQMNGGATAPTWVTASSGGLLQMVHTEISTEPTRSAGNTYADISGLNLTITPASTSNKILIVFNAGIVANSSESTSFVLKRAISGGATTILGGHTSGSRQAAWVRHDSDTDSNHDYGVHAEYYDTTHNTTSAITYTVQWISQGTVYLNRSEGYGDGAQSYQTLTNSRIYAQEIGV